MVVYIRKKLTTNTAVLEDCVGTGDMRNSIKKYLLPLRKQQGLLNSKQYFIFLACQPGHFHTFKKH